MAMQACVEKPTGGKKALKHHTAEGFRNFPVVEDSSELGLSFYMHRFISALSSPVVPESHILSEESAIELYQKF